MSEAARVVRGDWVCLRATGSASARGASQSQVSRAAGSSPRARSRGRSGAEMFSWHDAFTPLRSWGSASSTSTPRP
eukprot:2998349-Pyramimonas_sp.AAC.1